MKHNSISLLPLDSADSLTVAAQEV